MVEQAFSSCLVAGSNPVEPSMESTTHFIDDRQHFRRRLVCKRCHAVMNDYEPSCRTGEFYHATTWSRDKKGKAVKVPIPNSCKNAGKVFTLGDLGPEVELFVRKKARRSDKRQGFTRIDGHD